MIRPWNATHRDDHLPKALQNLRIPAVGAPLFIISNPDLVIAQCKAGVIGSFPALNARETEGESPLLDTWLIRIKEALDRHNQKNPDTPAASYAVNQIVHRSNTRLQRDIEICAKHEVPVWITSLGAREEVNQAAHSCGGIVLHDIINNMFAHKAIRKGADGLVAVAAGAGGHAGQVSPFALIQEIREWFDGPLLLSGSIATGRAILSARVLGADLAYIGSPFIATDEANADPAYKQMILDSCADDIVLTSLFTGVSGNYLKPSISNAGMDPDNLPDGDASTMNFGAYGSVKPRIWKDIWGCGQGVGMIRAVQSAGGLVAQLAEDYRTRQAMLLAHS
ncbi:MAG: nitronate monooxygenase [Rhodobacteraceae bacterium]|nr:nitronate monooxygenase [Paracoccaceae bacterium]